MGSLAGRLYENVCLINDLSILHLACQLRVIYNPNSITKNVSKHCIFHSVTCVPLNKWHFDYV